MQLREMLAHSSLAALAIGCGGEHECSSEFTTELVLLPDQECPANSGVAVRMLTEQLGWSAPTNETLTAKLMQSRSSSALTICWYELGEGFTCSAGARQRALDAAKACTATSPSVTLVGNESTTICGDPAGVMLHGEIVWMDDADQTVSCPAKSSGETGFPFVGSDVYPVCKRCEYEMTDTYECEGGGFGAIPWG